MIGKGAPSSTASQSSPNTISPAQRREITGPVTLVELGSGYSLKTDHLLRAWLACAPSVRYIPVDVSEAALCEACRIICNLHLSARVIGVNGDYREAFP